MQAQHRALDSVPEAADRIGARLSIAPPGCGNRSPVSDAAYVLPPAPSCIAGEAPIRTSGRNSCCPCFVPNSIRELKKAAGRRATKMGLWECTLCGHCEENCPQSIPIPELILKLREKTIGNESDLVPSFHSGFKRTPFKIPQSVWKREERADGVGRGADSSPRGHPPRPCCTLSGVISVTPREIKRWRGR